MSFNLIDQLTAEDKIKIENYIRLWGVADGFIGLDAWLEHWAKNKIKMYKLLGGNFIYHVPFTYEKSEQELRTQVGLLVNGYGGRFKSYLFDWFDINKEVFSSEVRAAVKNCLYIDTIIEDKTPDKIKFRLSDAKKEFQLQAGTKPLRALSRFLNYCKDIPETSRLINELEQFRIKHSIVMNNRRVKSDLVISIHPLDFMTMSDNASNWQSCMSWKNEGCYRVGTVEMMNSNNVLCCYMENSEPYYFGDEYTDEYKWANKKWRQLIYFTKDIIVSGKPYPYYNEDITKALVQAVRKLAKENLGWSYSFGPELYQDMKYINSSMSMERVRNFIANGDTKKHNIIFDSRGMYNDMLNDNYTKYWCVRNKVKHNKIISYSGKAPCLCCGESVISRNWDDDHYNDRFDNTGMVICNDCTPRFTCNICGCVTPNKKHHIVYMHNSGEEMRVCDSCIKQYIKKCPECGNSTYFGLDNNHKEDTHINAFIQIKKEIDESELDKRLIFINLDQDDVKRHWKTVKPVCMCGECAEKKGLMRAHMTIDSGWHRREVDVYLSKGIENPEDWEKYMSWNLEDVELADGEVIQS
jgi:hypothetical protein